MGAAFFSSMSMPISRIHPATRLAFWIALLVAVQLLEGTVLLATLLSIPVFGRRVGRRAWRLVWRARWLLLSLFVVFAWGIPGEAVWDDGLLAPTYEGLAEGWRHLGRMLLVLTTVAAFLEFTPLADLLVATRGLLRPFQRLGMNTDSGVVRLMLALRYVETLPRPRDWKVLLEMPELCTSEVVEIEQPVLGYIDGLLIGALGMMVIALFYW